jgi:hypothetical protein
MLKPPEPCQVSMPAASSSSRSPWRRRAPPSDASGPEDAFLDDGLHLSDAIGRQGIRLVERDNAVVGALDVNGGDAA